MGRRAWIGIATAAAYVAIVASTALGLRDEDLERLDRFCALPDTCCSFTGPALLLRPLPYAARVAVVAVLGLAVLVPLVKANGAGKETGK